MRQTCVYDQYNMFSSLHIYMYIKENIVATYTKIRNPNWQLVRSWLFAANNQLETLNHRLAYKFNKLMNKPCKDMNLINTNCSSLHTLIKTTKNHIKISNLQLATGRQLVIRRE